ncbi:hypothetical protein FRZ67_22800 [Panacibacter ginsenosidivorans]|uniref:PNPLA domain-containing protein n=1 Tax=Panacibacter ginsenosidivorans TaxID=1813871 RepID=A0A5B8VI77_9BACT|nr:hypothetical protein [Panacibacter ginsenosidivorans]QEC69988.1 hypothetical protein FRZ67_22800 [Panacibacter ginsenosidivorans]
MNISSPLLFEPKGFLQQLSYVLKTIFLLFPSAVFIVITWQVFWVLTQGKDILITALEKDWVAGFFLLALLFYVLVTWYSGRILIYRKTEIIYILAKNVSQNNKQKEFPVYLQLIFNMPRFFGYIIFALIWIGLLKLVYWPGAASSPNISGTISYLLLLLVSVLYVVQYSMTKKLREKLFETNDENKKPLRIKLLGAAGIVVLALIIINFLICNVWLLIISLIVIQAIFLFVVIIRRNIRDMTELPRLNNNNKQGNAGFEQWKQNCGITTGNNLLLKFMYFANIPYKEKALLITFMFIGIAALTIYSFAIGSLQWSLLIGSLTFVMLAFGVLVLVFSGVSVLSVAKKINFHFLFLVIAIIEGMFNFLEPHKVMLTDNAKSQEVFTNRPDIKTYFTHWMASHANAIDSSAAYPVVFILADGGASRSGYWTASILSSLDEKSKLKFSQHLFCLSVASGGSVGNAAYYALLKKRYNNQAPPADSLLQTVRDYLSADFLTYTLARMLGPDVLRFLLPVFGTDRADALRVAMNEGGIGELKGAMADDLIDYIGDTALIYALPILCINTTHMQDATPAVISTVKINDSIYGRKMDVLSLLPSGKSMQLSTATILGARFPYISPAGRIAENDSIFHYFVDGGYFDNSGAGFVHETILYLHDLISDTALLDTKTKERYSKLKFYVIHAMNSPVSTGKTNNVPPLQNDLMAPILTLMGSYESQTSVNNIRLKNYLKEINKDTVSYIDVGLYDSLDVKNEADRIPMNWSISQHFVGKINEQLNKQFLPGRMLPAFLEKIK